MKKLTAVFLAIVLALSLPLIFATNEFDAHEHDHHHECDLCGAGGASPMGEWDYCPICQIITWQQTYSYYPDVYEDAGDGGHWAITYGYIKCLECGSTIHNNVRIGAAWEEHFYDHSILIEGIWYDVCICDAIIGH